MAPEQTATGNPQQTSRPHAGNVVPTAPQPTHSHGRGQAQRESSRNYLSDALDSMLLVGLVPEQRIKEIMQLDPKAQLQLIAVLRRDLDKNLPLYSGRGAGFNIRETKWAQSCLTRFEDQTEPVNDKICQNSNRTSSNSSEKNSNRDEV